MTITNNVVQCHHITQPGISQFESPPTPDSETGSDIRSFNAFLRSQEDLASVTGGVSAADFVIDTVEKSIDQGLKLTSRHLALILESAFGTPDRVAGLLSGYTAEEATKRYGDLYPVLAEYASLSYRDEE